MSSPCITVPIDAPLEECCRLMEEYGISYYFKHSDGEHKLIMTDEMSTFEAIEGGRLGSMPIDLFPEDNDFYF